jgi:ADP-ribose pyrophosphatase
VADHEFRTVSSETLHVGKIFALRADEVEMPGGRTAVREVVEHFGAVGVVAMNENNDIALIYQYRHTVGRRLWELPAGLLDAAGESPEVAAARELAEEAGLAARDWGVLVDVLSAPGFSDESVRIYLASGLTEVDRPEAHDEEADLRLEWVSLADAVKMVLSGEIVNSLAVAGILAARTIDRDVQDLRPVTSPWLDRPTRFAARRATE